ncbi:MAG: DeoR/GlpR family DNA-binding transcription regulator [Lachnospiraceae bacterium]
MKKRLTAERRNEIAQLLLRNGNIKAGELAIQFDVSTETIRKDLIFLEEQGIARKSYGGAIASTELAERPVALKQMERMDIKTAIAHRALKLIPEKGVVILDAGSTTYALAKLLTLKNDLTIFTNSLIALNLLSDSPNQVFALGGRIRESSKGTIGVWAIQALASLHADIAFLGTDGFKDLAGPSSASYEESELKQVMIAHSEKTVILCDHTKLRSNSLFQFCDWSEVYALIINQPEAPEETALIDKINKKTNVFLSE